MSLTNPPNTPLPPVPPVPNRRTDDQHAFDDKTDAYLNWLVAFAVWLAAIVAWLRTFVAQIGPTVNGLTASAEAHKNSALAAAASAEASARQAALTAGATRWQAGSYAQGDVVWSPISLLTYRRVSAGNSSTDPASDPAGWRLMGTAASFPQVTLSGAGPHQLAPGMHYLITSADCVAKMPANPNAQEQVRVTNLSASAGPVLQRSSKTFRGHADDLLLDRDNIDRLFTFTSANGWV